MGKIVDRILQQVAAVERKANEVAAEVAKEVGIEADAYAGKIMVPIAKQEIRLEFRDAVDAWYAAYSPKIYRRAYDLYGVLTVSDGDDNYVGWEYDDSGLNKPSWFKGYGSYNIYGLVFEGGSHGGPMRNYTPVVSTPIPTMFENAEADLWPTMQSQFDELAYGYFNENAPERLSQRLNDAFGI